MAQGQNPRISVANHSRPATMNQRTNPDHLADVPPRAWAKLNEGPSGRGKAACQWARTEPVARGNTRLERPEEAPAGSVKPSPQWERARFGGRTSERGQPHSCVPPFPNRPPTRYHRHGRRTDRMTPISTMRTRKTSSPSSASGCDVLRRQGPVEHQHGD